MFFYNLQYCRLSTLYVVLRLNVVSADDVLLINNRHIATLAFKYSGTHLHKNIVLLGLCHDGYKIL